MSYESATLNLLRALKSSLLIFELLVLSSFTAAGLFTRKKGPFLLQQGNGNLSAADDSRMCQDFSRKRRPVFHVEHCYRLSLLTFSSKKNSFSLQCAQYTVRCIRLESSLSRRFPLCSKSHKTVLGTDTSFDGFQRELALHSAVLDYRVDSATWEVF